MKSPCKVRVSKVKPLDRKDWINDQGYDLIVIPRGASLAHDGQKFRVFTKPEYRNSSSKLGEPDPISKSRTFRCPEMSPSCLPFS